MDGITPGWHFVGDRLRDGRPVPADGEWLVHEGPVRICANGLHGSERIIDALRYAPGNTICRCEFRDIAGREHDKLVARERRILWRVDGEPILRKFARRRALGVIHLWDAPAVVREYLETGNEDLRAAAWAAAKDAAWAAARDAARAAARAAARDAVWAAARDAAWDAAWAAGRDAARAAAWAAGRDAANEMLTSMVMEARNG